MTLSRKENTMRVPLEGIKKHENELNEKQERLDRLAKDAEAKRKRDIFARRIKKRQRLLQMQRTDEQPS